MTETFDPHEHEVPFWEPIGQFVIAFGYLEMRVNDAIANLLQIHHRQGEAITSQILNLRSRIRLIEKLCHLLTADVGHREEMSDIVKQIVPLNTYRNNLLHGPWGSYHIPPKGEGYWQKISVGPQDFKYKVIEIRLSEILPNTNKTIELNSRLTNLVQKILRAQQQNAEQPPSPDTPG